MGIGVESTDYFIMEFGSLSHMIFSYLQVCYGTTENSPVTYQTFVDTPLDKRVSSVGHPAPHTEVKLVYMLVYSD